MQNKLLSETGKLVAKEDLQLHIAGADNIKNAYEKKNKREDNILFSAPKASIQKTFTELNAEAVPGKTLEDLKIGQRQTNWKWKQKTMNDLNESMKMFKDHGINTPAKIEARHQKLIQTEKYLDSKKATVTNAIDVEEIKRLQDLRDKEVENFLNEMKSYIEKPSFTNRESSLKSGITDYLDLIEDDNNEMTKNEGDINLGEQKDQVNKNLTKIGQVSNIKQLLEKETQDGKRDSGGELGSNENNPDRWKRGKVDTSFLINQLNKNANDTNNKFADPAISSVNSNKIRQQLESQCAKNEEEKPLLSAPKRKLKIFEPQQVVEKPKSTSTESYLEVRAAETDYKKYKKLYTEQAAKLEKDKKPIESSYSQITDENERKAAILAKFGCKPRPQRVESNSSSSSTSSDEYDAEADDEENKVNENNIPLHIVQSNAMYAIYGDRLADKAPQKKEKNKKEDSSEFVLQMLKAMRQGAQPHNPHSGGPRKPRQDSVDSSDIDYSDVVPGSCADMKSKFEGRSAALEKPRAPPPPKRAFLHTNKR